MRIQVFSDVQLDASKGLNVPEKAERDVAVIAGDLTPGLWRGVKWAAENFGDAPVVYVPGNRDFYVTGSRGDADTGDNMEEALVRARKDAAELGIHLLYNDAVEIGGVRFVGTTLWTDYEINGDREVALALAELDINDHRLIKSAQGPFTAKMARAEHLRCRAFIERALAEPFDGPTVVVTHHAPHPGSIAPAFAGTGANGAFVSDLRALMGEAGPDIWIHGATHHKVDYREGRTRIVSNPVGYPHEETGFDPKMVVKVAVPSPSPTV